MKNIITFENLTDGYKSIEVENFSDKNVKEAISKVLGIKTKFLKCESSSASQGIYSIPRNLNDDVFEKLTSSHYCSITDKQVIVLFYGQFI